MLSIVHTAEVQLRHESAMRDRGLAVRAAIREREAGIASERVAVLRAPRQLAWPRPIGAMRSELDCCAVA